MNAVFAFTIPSQYNATDPCKNLPNCVLQNAQQFTLNNYLTSGIASGYNLTLSFSLINPPTEQPVTQSFQVIASDNNYPSFTATTFLDPTQSYVAGLLNSFTVQSSDYKTYDSAIYTLSFYTNHKVLQGSTLIFSFPSTFGISSITLVSASITGVLAPNAQNIAGNPTVSNLFASDITTPFLIQVIFKNVQNPSFEGTYSGFNVKITSGGYNIDLSASQSIIINAPAYATITCQLSNYTNDATTNYTFTFQGPGLLPINLVNPHYLTIDIPSDISYCDPNSIISMTTGLGISSISGTNPIQFQVSIPSATPAIALNITCKNPPTTKPTNLFYLNLSVLINSIETAALTGNVSISTLIGENLQITNFVQNIPTSPGYQSIVTFSIQRVDTTISINKIIIVNPSPSTNQDCTTDFAGSYTCKESGNNIVITFNTPWTSSTLTINNIASLNPQTEAAAVSSNPFTLKTYYTLNGVDYLVDQSNNAGKIIVNCNFPCKTCSNIPNYCLTCVDNIQNAKYYLTSDTSTCLLIGASGCGSGYYQDDLNKICLKCTGDCKECYLTSTNCTACIDPTKVLLNNQCLLSCGNGYYVPAGSFACQPCQVPCLNCANTGTGCTSCQPNYFLSNSQCVSTCAAQTYGDAVTNTCLSCDLKSCYTCTQTATTCTSCLGTFLLSGTCVSASVCTSTNDHIADTSKWLCTPCAYPCSKCISTVSQCTQCTGTMAIYMGNCVNTCPYGYYNGNNVCSPCNSNCAGCSGSATACLACQANALMVEDTKECVFSCGTNYYISGSNCLMCNSSCLTCYQNASLCTGCAVNLYLLGSTCVSSCPLATYSQGANCVACNSVCATCTNSADRCTQCAPGFLLRGSNCVSFCPAGTIASSSMCISCDPTCSTCSGITTNCLSCTNPDAFAYLGNCTSTCPIKTVQSNNASSVKTCISCSTGCDICTLSEGGNSTNQTNCTKCTTGYKWLNNSCYFICPQNYSISNDGLQCIKNGTVDPTKPTNNSSSLSDTTSAKANYVAFPNLIIGFALCVVSIIGTLRDSRTMLLSNIIILWSALAYAVFILQIILAILNSEIILFAVTLASIAFLLVENLLFLFAYNSFIFVDQGYIKWAEINKYLKMLVISLSSCISFQFNRLYYSRLVGISIFFVHFEDMKNIFIPLNYFSFAEIITHLFPVVIIDIVYLAKLTLTTQLYVTMIESLILSIFLIIFTAYEMKYANQIPEELLDDRAYSQLNSNTLGGILNEEQLKDNVLQQVLDTIEAHKNKKTQIKLLSLPNPNLPERRRSCIDFLKIELEHDPRILKSYPPSPKTTNAKEIPCSEEHEELKENVYFESKPPKDSNVKTELKKTQDFEQQTPPFKKIDDFKKFLSGNLSPKNKKIFDGDKNAWSTQGKSKKNGSVSPELKEQNLTSKQARTPNDIEIKYPHSIAEDKDLHKRSNIIQNGSRQDLVLNAPLGNIQPGSPPFGEQNNIKSLSNTHLGINSERNLTHKTLLDKQKTPEIFESIEGFKFSLAHVKTSSKNQHRIHEIKKVESKPAIVKEKNNVGQDILGTFEHDQDNTIIIREAGDGHLLDAKGRKVNEFGYLTDRDGNIVTSKGDVVLSKYDFIEAINSESPAFKSNKDTIENKARTLEEKEESPLKKSEQEDPLIEQETPVDLKNNSKEKASSDSYEDIIEFHQNINEKLDTLHEEQKQFNSANKIVLKKQNYEEDMLSRTRNPITSMMLERPLFSKKSRSKKDKLNETVKFKGTSQNVLTDSSPLGQPLFLAPFLKIEHKKEEPISKGIKLSPINKASSKNSRLFKRLGSGLRIRKRKKLRSKPVGTVKNRMNAEYSPQLTREQPENDEISSRLAENYAAMETKFAFDKSKKDNLNLESPVGELPDIFKGNKRFYHNPKF